MKERRLIYDDLICDGIAVRHCLFLVCALCKKMCLTILVCSVFSSDHEIYEQATTDNIHSHSYEETLAKHFTQRLQLVN